MGYKPSSPLLSDRFADEADLQQLATLGAIVRVAG